MSAIKERPILFSAPMVRAIQEGRKTVTRRTVKVHPRSRADIGSYGLGQPFIRNPDVTKPNSECPYGRPGDRLWLRETHFINDYREAKVPEAERADTEIVYRADPLPCWEGEESEIRWRPSIFMPRWASRILLEITAVRVERLQDISEEQSEAEGVYFLRAAPDFDETLTAKQLYEILWDHINGNGAWDANPWVWVVEFKGVTA